MRIVFMGSPADVVSPLAHLHSHGPGHGFEIVGVVSQPARPVGRGGLVQDPPVAAWAKEHHIPTLQPESAKAADFLKDLRAWNPDVIVTAAYGQILSDEFLKIPNRATINIHPSLLPKYRGATPVPAAVLDGLTATAVSILFTVKKLDAGNIILAQAFDINIDENAGELTSRLFAESGAMLLDALEKLKDPNFAGTPQDDTQATFCKKIEKESGAIDWTQDAKTIANRFRAFEPWPGSWTHLADRRVVVTALKVHSEATPSLSPGEFIFDKPTKSLVVGTGRGLVQILGVKPAGGKAMDAAGFWNGLKDKTAAKFSNLTSKIPVAVAVSGGGRSLKNLLDHEAKAPWKIAAIISSAPDCGAVKIAQDAGIPLIVGDFSKNSRTATTEKLIAFLAQYKIEWIVLAGFLKLFPNIPSFQNRVINIHPALLPKFGGKGMHGHHVHEAVLAAKEPLSGATIHFVNERYDEGAAIAQIEVNVESSDDPEKLAAKVFAAECKLLPWALTELCLNRLPLAKDGIQKLTASP